MSLGAANVDHVVLSGARWRVIDAKGTGAGTLTTDARGRGLLIQADGAQRPEPWLDLVVMHSIAAVLARLTGMRGWPVWVTPDATSHDPQVLRARAFRYGGTICSIGNVYSGSLDKVFPVPQRPADPDVVAALSRYLPPEDGPDVGARERPDRAI